MPKLVDDEPAVKITPAYLAYETLRNFIESLHATAVPDHIGKGLMPNLSGGSQSHLLLALKFLKLIGSDGATTNELRELVRAFGGEKWPAAIGKVLMDAYKPILGGLNIASTSDEQLYKAFKERTPLDDSVLERAVRFFIRAMRDAKIPLSPHLGKRKPRRTNKAGSAKPPKAKESRNGSGDTGNGAVASTTLVPEGMIEIPIPIGNSPSFIRVPKGITMSQFPMVKAIADLIEALAKQNSPSN